MITLRYLLVSLSTLNFAASVVLGQSLPYTQATGALQPPRATADPRLTPDHLQFLGPDGLLPEERVGMAVYEICNRGVVNISTRSQQLDRFSLLSVSQGSGSGSVLDREGTILTNHHVIEDAREITVSLYNGNSYTGRVIGEDPATDIAVLKIDAPPEELFPIEWGDSSRLAVGQRIYSLGNPFGLERTMGRGIVSSLNRQIASKEKRTMRSLIQIDATLNQGNSGGPLLNTRGQLIGMNTAIMSNDGDSSGVGFAIPVATIQRIVPQLITNGRVVRPTLGITRVYEKDDGVLLVVSLTEGGPAEQAGLRGFQLVTRTFRQGIYVYEQTRVDPSQADAIVAVDNTRVHSADELLSSIETKRPGETVTLTIVREGKTMALPIVLGVSR